MDLKEDLQPATFACGKFWGVQFYFDQVPGVIDSTVGYTGGQTENPTKEAIASGLSDHTEAIRISFDPSLVNYDTLLKHFFRIHDPTTAVTEGKEGGDRFRSVIFYHSDEQKILAEIVMKELSHSYKKPLKTELVQAGPFYPAAEDDQKYTEKTGKGMQHLPYEPA